MSGLAECADCHEPIRFVEIPAQQGRKAAWIPVNPRGGPTGAIVANLTGRIWRGRFLAAGEQEVRTPLHGYVPLAGETHYVPHADTCRERTSTTTPTPEPVDPALF